VRIGDQISGKYRLLRRLGEGGMGEVWAARNELTNRDFAIKLLLPDMARNPEALERFFREARATGQLRHPHLASVYDVGKTADERPYLVMELLTGESLEERLLRERRLPQRQVCLLFSQIAWALQAAHRAGVVHRDLSSANVYLAASEEARHPVPKILDFGVSKFLGPSIDGRVRTADGAVLGSPAYMSPEQACGAETVDERTDLWALGILMYECLAGHRPFGGANYNALLFAILNAAHQPLVDAMPEVDVELAELVSSCLIKDRSVREYSARNVAERLERIAWRLSSSRDTAVPRRRRATDRMSLQPEGGRLSRPGLDDVGLSRAIQPAAVRWWNRFTRRGGPSKVVATASALVGAGVGITLGVLVASAAQDDSPSTMGASAAVGHSPPASLASAPAVTVEPSPPVPRLSASVAPSRQASIAAGVEEPGLVEAMARGLGLDAASASADDRARKRKGGTIPLSKPAPR
jgi:serine/threonine protein kinase